jgi:dihydrofolate synthase/folylpolyglutamate synthase
MFNQPLCINFKAHLLIKRISNTHLLINHLSNPHKSKCVHVAGTNGKGSTSHMLASVLQEAGYKVGLYTSPHLKDFRERIKINGADITEKFVCDFMKTNLLNRMTSVFRNECWNL